METLKRIRWEAAQRLYSSWSSSPLPEFYVTDIKKVGSEFAEFIGSFKRCVDVGCGNGRYAGKTYAEVGYSYLNKPEGSFVLGVDPIGLVNAIPWVDCYVKAKIEDVSLQGFDLAVFSTSFDHILDIGKALRNLRSGGVNRICVWETLYYRHTIPNAHHVRYYTYKEFEEVLRESGYYITRSVKVESEVSKQAAGWFVEAKNLW